MVGGGLGTVSRSTLFRSNKEDTTGRVYREGSDPTRVGVTSFVKEGRTGTDPRVTKGTEGTQGE